MKEEIAVKESDAIRGRNKKEQSQQIFAHIHGRPYKDLENLQNTKDLRNKL